MMPCFRHIRNLMTVQAGRQRRRADGSMVRSRKRMQLLCRGTCSLPACCQQLILLLMLFAPEIQLAESHPGDC